MKTDGDHPHRQTRQRRAILEVLRRAGDHPTAGEIHARARRRLPHLSLGTVYRNLALLTREGRITRIALPGHPARYDREAGMHDHVRCIRCGRITDVPPSATGTPERRARRIRGYAIVGRRVEFLGICPTCQEAGRAQARKRLPLGRRGRVV